MKTLQKPTCCKCGGTYINFDCDVGWNEETRTLEVEDLWDYPHRCLDCEETVTIRWVPFDAPLPESPIDPRAASDATDEMMAAGKIVLALAQEE